MAVKIIPEPDIHVTQEDYERYWREWRDSQRMTTTTVSYEVWLRRRLAQRADLDEGTRREVRFIRP